MPTTRRSSRAIPVSSSLDLDPTARTIEGAHYGVVVSTSDEVDAVIDRLRRAGCAVDLETNETCRYAVRNEVWATDPDGWRWETYHVVAETDVNDDTATSPLVRRAMPHDIEAIRRIHNEGVADRIATLDTEPKSEAEMTDWWATRGGRYAVLVAEESPGDVVGWASLNPYSLRRAHAGIADLSVYVARRRRGSGVGRELLSALEPIARANEFHKIVLFALVSNARGRSLYEAMGYTEVGVFHEHGRLDGAYVDVVAMEKIL